MSVSIDSKVIYQAIVNSQVIDITDDQIHELDLLNGQDHYHLIHNNISYRIEVIDTDFDFRKITLLINGQLLKVDLRNQTDMTVSAMGLDAIQAVKESNLLSPMPGRILDILVQKGDKVQEGDHLLILEAMKMENVLKANHDSVIKTIHARVGDSVEKNSPLLDFEE